MSNKGLLISFEGISGAGKTVLIDNFEKYLKKNGYLTIRKSDLYFYKGKGLGKDIKDILKKYSQQNNENPFFQFGFPIIETLLILAKRSFESEERLNPHYLNNYIILADRDIDTVCTYQLVSLLQYNPEYSKNKLIKLMHNINSLNTKSPDLTFYLDVSVKVAVDRVKNRDNRIFNYDQINFLRNAKNYYNEVFSVPLNNRVLKKINTSNISINEVTSKCIRIFEQWKKKKQY
jgi:dTMP kinase